MAFFALLPKSVSIFGKLRCSRWLTITIKQNFHSTSTLLQIANNQPGSENTFKAKEDESKIDSFDVKVKENVSEVTGKAKTPFGYDQNGRKAENREGLFYLNMIQLPKDLKDSLAKFYKKHPAKVLTADGKQLARYLRNRGRPTERSWRKYKESSKISHKSEQDADVDETVKEKTMHDLNLDSGDPLKDQSGSEAVLKRDLKTQPRRPPKASYSMLRYGKKEIAAFAASRIPACFGATKRVFSELRKREPGFEPKTLLDFGSGTGTALWAANDVWGRSLKEYQCVDVSDDANKVCEYLLRGGDDPRLPLKIPGVYFKKFLPLTHKITYDVVVASYALSEMPFAKQRQAAIASLWEKTNDFLIIIEPGNNEGFDIALQARHYVTKRATQEDDVFSELIGTTDQLKSDDSNDGNDIGADDSIFFTSQENDSVDPGFVYAPCPHDVSCARSEVDSRDHPCNFEQKVDLSFSQRNTSLKRWGYVRERFSYVILRKGQRNESDHAFSRLLHPPKLKKKHVYCDICTRDGSIERHVFTKRKDPELYKGTRHCLKWGDLMPEMSSEKKAVKVIRFEDTQVESKDE